MKKNLYFTIDGRQSDERNGIKTYQCFEYDTETGDLSFIDSFMNDIKKASMGKAVTTTPTSGTTEEPTTDNTSGTTEP